VSTSHPTGRIWRTGSLAATVLIAVFLALLIADGWLYLLRDAGWLGVGPRLVDSLPLLQLAGFDRQPLLRVLVAWVLAGLMVGLLLRRMGRLERVAATGPLALILLLLGSQAAYALARNLRFTHVLTSRAPGLGAWLEAVFFALGCALPGRAVAGRDWLARRPSLPRSVRAGGQLGLSGGELGYAGEHERDRQ
jgi:hypothetical protein